MKPTKEQFGTFQNLYDFLNRELFQDELDNCILTMIPKNTKYVGHFWPEKWFKNEKKIHEISMNPHGYAINESEFFVSILVHEMCHLWVHDFTDKPPRKGYHCKKWGSKMKEIGLYPSNTGEPGGKETGQQMTHYIVDGGLYQEVYNRMDKTLLLPFKRYDTPPKEKKAKSKVKYTCLDCDTNVWGKPGLNIRCFNEDCDCQMESEDC